MRSSIEAGPTNGQEGHTNLPRSDSNKVDRTKNPGGQRESEQLVPTSGPLKEKDISDHLRCFFDKWERSRTGRCTAWGACRWGSSFSVPCFLLIPASREHDKSLDYHRMCRSAATVRLDANCSRAERVGFECR